MCTTMISTPWPPAQAAKATEQQRELQTLATLHGLTTRPPESCPGCGAPRRGATCCYCGRAA